ncbi:hypothetical protein [Desulfosporosinus nitroreducens]|uniref:hypothetical protein n=1 Tax=Desulfosporosinus nitroreducens TaxID=2018668 RepID=UPI00207CD43E|nr:hypothetical protein [Desulfosporosinus nitroreducens]MCO1603498.1 hypothetical protein [Desulfosporosinus nitroreducens]
MSGIKFLFISGKGEVCPIPASKGSDYKAAPELANESVLVVELFYEVKNRKPWRLIHVGFDRIQLDEHGQYILTLEERVSKFYNISHFGLATAEELSKREEPVTIPKALVVPNAKEKEALISFIKRKYPILWKNSPEAIEVSIQSRLNTHLDLVSLVKKSTVIRQKNKITVDKQE